MSRWCYQVGTSLRRRDSTCLVAPGARMAMRVTSSAVCAMMSSGPALERASCQAEYGSATTRALGLRRVSVMWGIRGNGKNRGNKANGDANRRAGVMQDFMSIRFNKSPHCRPRQCLSVTAARGRATTLLAGIRAGGTTSIAFPSACSNAQWP